MNISTNKFHMVRLLPNGTTSLIAFGNSERDCFANFCKKTFPTTSEYLLWKKYEKNGHTFKGFSSISFISRKTIKYDNCCILEIA